MSVAFDQRVRYYGEYLSENIAQTPEGYLICRNAVLGRSGFQKYLASELTDPEGLVKDRGPSEEIEVWRPEDQVFAIRTMASFEGKTFTLLHPQDMLTPENEREHHVGHAQNVRKGEDPLEDGNWPLLGDILVTDSHAIRAIKEGARQLSCGYSYRLVKNGERLEQHDIVGNHIALVESARAGNEARINDSASSKENKVMTVKERILKILGIGIKEFTKDADPVEVAKTQSSLSKFSAVMDAMSEEGNVEPPKTQDDDKKLTDDKAKAKDDDDKKKAKDDDDRKRLHDALESILKKKEEKKQAGDADIEELKKQLNEYFTEEEQEAEHSGDDELKPIEEGERRAADDDDKKAKDDDDDDDDDKKKAKDASEVVRPEPNLKEGESPESQFDSARVVLKSLRPFVARSNNKGLIAAFNVTMDSVRKGIKRESERGGGYTEFLAATRSGAKDEKGAAMKPPEESPVQKRARELDAMYAQERERRSRSLPAAK